MGLLAFWAAPDIAPLTLDNIEPPCLAMNGSENSGKDIIVKPINIFQKSLPLPMIVAAANCAPAKTSAAKGYIINIDSIKPLHFLNQDSVFGSR
jgi:hypothetical protein